MGIVQDNPGELLLYLNPTMNTSKSDGGNEEEFRRDGLFLFTPSLI